MLAKSLKTTDFGGAGFDLAALAGSGRRVVPEPDGRGPAGLLVGVGVGMVPFLMLFWLPVEIGGPIFVLFLGLLMDLP